MKQLFILSTFILFTLGAFAQETENPTVTEGGFKKENLFTGGDVLASFGNQYTNIGLGPFFGYSVNKYLDVAASLNFNYSSQRDYYTTAKLRQTNFGPGAFVRVFPVKFIFAQAQYEHNFISQRYKSPSGSNVPDQVAKFDVNSMLVGAGLASGRNTYNKSFGYISVLWDVLRLQNSPYTDNLNRAVPIFRVGYNIALFQKK